MNDKEDLPENDKIPEPKDEKVSKSPVNFKMFDLNVKMEKFEERIINEILSINNILDSNKILLVVDHKNSRVWIWKGKNTTAKMKFISAQRAPYIRDKFGSDYTITTIDDGEESAEFRQLFE